MYLPLGGLAQGGDGNSWDGWVKFSHQGPLMFACLDTPWGRGGRGRGWGLLVSLPLDGPVKGGDTKNMGWVKFSHRGPLRFAGLETPGNPTDTFLLETLPVKSYLQITAKNGGLTKRGSQVWGWMGHVR